MDSLNLINMLSIKMFGAARYDVIIFLKFVILKSFQIQRMIRKDQQHEKLNRNYTLSFGIKKSLRRNVSRLSIFDKNSENRLNIKASINRKLTSILSYMKIL